MHQAHATLKLAWKWEQNATCYCYAQAPKKTILLLQSPLTASKFPWGGGVMALFCPVNHCLACSPSTRLLLSFQKRIGCWSLWKHQFQARQGQVLWPASTGNRGRVTAPVNRWKLLFSEVRCLGWGSNPVSRVCLPYSRVILCEHAFHSEIAAGCSPVPPLTLL